MKKLNLGNIEILNKEKRSLASEVLQTIDLENFPLSMIHFDKDKNIRVDYSNIEELAKSIKDTGQLQPIGISKILKSGKHKLVYGFRRFIAIKEHLKNETIKVTLVSEFESLETVQLIENIQREDLSDYEIAKTLKTLKDQTKETNIQLAKRLSKTERWIEDKLSHFKIMQAPLTGLPEKDRKIFEEIPSSLVNEARGLKEEKKKEVLKEIIETKKITGKLPTQKDIREKVNSVKIQSENKEKSVSKKEETGNKEVNVFKKKYYEMSEKRKTDLVNKLIGDFIRNKKERKKLTEKINILDSVSMELTSKLKAIKQESKLTKVLSDIRNKKQTD